ncbi:MAG: carbon-nitrogen hydrolase family protein [Subtercola sp.]|jgi:predicted amidohydrolase|nr:carbon-nitrogen hydrolase family protein [Subtercola sp.]
MKFASGQFAAGTDPIANLGALTDLIKRAAEAGAEFIVLPESSLYLAPDLSPTPEHVPEPLDGPFITAIASAAAQYSIGVVVGTTEKNPNGFPYNTVVAISSLGEVTARYRKVHLYDAFGFVESDTITPGEIEEPFILNFDGLKVGVFTCYDLRFPESARRVIDAGANVLLLPACWAAGPAKEDQWTTLVRARAIENTSYVVSANQSGPVGTGFSQIVDPAGTVLANAGEAPGLIFADLDVNRVDVVRKRVPSLQNRRFSVVPS